MEHSYKRPLPFLYILISFKGNITHFWPFWFRLSRHFCRHLTELGSLQRAIQRTSLRSFFCHTRYNGLLWKEWSILYQHLLSTLSIRPLAELAKLVYTTPINVDFILVVLLFSLFFLQYNLHFFLISDKSVFAFYTYLWV